MPAASIIIRTKNEGKYIGRCLQQVYRQRYTDFEVILVDSGSTDGTLEIAERFPIRLITIRPETFTYGYALNIGVAATRAPIIVSLSGHSIPYDSRWLGNLMRRFDDPKVAGAYSRQVCYPTSPIYEKIFVYSMYGHPVRIPIFSDLFFNNAAAAVRRDLWEQFPFDETLPGSEDHAWTLEARSRGYRAIYAYDSVVIHSHEESLARFIRRRIVEGRGLNQIYAARGKPAPAPSLRMLERLERWETAERVRERERERLRQLRDRDRERINEARAHERANESGEISV
jgi:glycosyltransferase involved in cell wall biosynthesis